MNFHILWQCNKFFLTEFESPTQARKNPMWNRRLKTWVHAYSNTSEKVSYFRQVCAIANLAIITFRAKNQLSTGVASVFQYKDRKKNNVISVMD